MNRAAILIIEDDADIRELLSFAFTGEGWKLIMAASGEDGLEILKNQKNRIDCIVLDIMLPGIDGLKTLKKIKALDCIPKNLPVIMATARGEESDIVAGLELGADDYVVKPYSPKVLAARIRVALRRLEEADVTRTLYTAGPVSLDSARHVAYNGNNLLDLSATEFSLLEHFLSHQEMVFSRDQIISAIHGSDYPVTDRSVDVQILSLRRKLADAGSMIETIRAVGYRFKSS